MRFREKLWTLLEGGQYLRDHLVDLPAFGASGQTLDEDGHHLALVARATGAHLGDHLTGGLDYLLAAHLGRQVGLEGRQLRLLFGYEVLPAPLLELPDALPALLDLLTEEAQHIFSQALVFMRW